MSVPWASRRWVLAAALLYLGCTLWALRAVLAAPAFTLPDAPTGAFGWDAQIRADQLYAVAQVTQSARRLRSPSEPLVGGDHCWPLARPTTLGDHLIGDSLLGVVPDVLFREPVLTYNLVRLVVPTIAGLGMYAWVSALTRSPPAALVAGLLFAVHPARLANAAQPSLMANQWTPFALLFAYWTFTRRRWRDAAGLACFTSLQLLDGLYPIVAFALIGGVYALSLLVHERRAWPALLPKLGFVAAVVGLVAYAVFGPYLETRATWGLLSGRAPMLYAPGDLAIGHRLYPGTVLALLALAGLVGRFRRSREAAGHDPRLALLAGAGLVLWAVLDRVPLPFLPGGLPSLLTLASGMIPGLDAVRGAGAVESGFFLVGAVLAGFGVASLARRAPERARGLLTAGLVVAVVLETFQPRLAQATFGDGFGRKLAFEPRLARPPDRLLALYRQLPGGAVLDLPANVGVAGAEHVFLAAYHERPTVGCYGSYRSPLRDEMLGIVSRLRTDEDAATALHALGIRGIVVNASRRARRRFGPLPPLPPQASFVPIGSSGPTMFYEIADSHEVVAGIDPLVAGAGGGGLVGAVAGAPTLLVPFRNGTSAAYRHPDPIEPRELHATWVDAAGEVAAQHVVEGLLPLALAPDETATRELPIPVPAHAASYRLVLRSGARSGPIVARAFVSVRAQTAPATPAPETSP